MNGNRNLIWGIAFSLAVHGALLNLPLSPGDLGTILPHKPMPLEISLVTVKAHAGGSTQRTPIRITHPNWVGPSVTVRGKKSSTRSTPLPQTPRAKGSAKVTRKGITEGGEKPTLPPKGERGLAPKPGPWPSAPRGKITARDVQPEEARVPLPSARNLLGRGGLTAKGLAPSRSHLTTLARPRYDQNPNPHYPKIARRKGYQGVVLLKVEILPNGRVGKVRVKRSSGHDLLDESALKAVRKWRFIPAKRGEDTIRIWAEVPIKFELE